MVFTGRPTGPPVVISLGAVARYRFYLEQENRPFVIDPLDRVRVGIVSRTTNELLYVTTVTFGEEDNDWNNGLISPLIDLTDESLFIPDPVTGIIPIVGNKRIEVQVSTLDGEHTSFFHLAEISYSVIPTDPVLVPSEGGDFSSTTTTWDSSTIDWSSDT